jgi:hypothetical protein
MRAEPSTKFGLSTSGGTTDAKVLVRTNGEKTSEEVSVTDRKDQFLRYELGLLSIKAAMSTRDGHNPVYASDIKVGQRSKVNDALQGILRKLEAAHAADLPVTEFEHIALIEDTAGDLTRRFGGCLDRGRFRIGVAQW